MTMERSVHIRNSNNSSVVTGKLKIRKRYIKRSHCTHFYVLPLVFIGASTIKSYLTTL